MQSQSSTSRSFLNHAKQFWAGTIAIGLSVLGGLPAVAYAESKPLPATEGLGALPDGTYLYGQAPEPDQIGQGYFVFEVTKGAVVGALYMPRSSFDCASGQFQGNQLALSVVNSYDRTTNPFAIALEKTSTVATSGNPALQQLGLQGFHRLSSLTENDQRLLGVCKADLQQSGSQKSIVGAAD